MTWIFPALFFGPAWATALTLILPTVALSALRWHERRRAGQVLVVGNAGSIFLYVIGRDRTLTQKLVLEGHAPPIYGVTFNHDGTRLASVGWDKTIRIWDAGSGQLVKSWDGRSDDIWGIAYSPDGGKLATGGHDGAVKLWNSQTGELLATYLGHKIAIHAIAFNQDGSLLASGGRDGAVRIWKIGSGPKAEPTH